MHLTANCNLLSISLFIIDFKVVEELQSSKCLNVFENKTLTVSRQKVNQKSVSWEIGESLYIYLQNQS